VRRSSASAVRRSGDPRKRAALPSPSDAGARRRLVLVAVVAGVGLLVVALLTLRGDPEEADDLSRGHAEAACDLTTDADEAGSVETNARLAAAMLLLDKAIIESARAANTNRSYADLDRFVQKVHTAAHRRDPEQYRTAMNSALAACRSAFG
jgi:hypothetical protein